MFSEIKLQINMQPDFQKQILTQCLKSKSPNPNFEYSKQTANNARQNCKNATICLH